MEKLRRLQPVLRALSKLIAHVQQKIIKARVELEKAQKDLIQNRMYNLNIKEVKRCTANFIKWNELEEDMLKKKDNIGWLRLGMETIHSSMPQ